MKPKHVFIIIKLFLTAITLNGFAQSNNKVELKGNLDTPKYPNPIEDTLIFEQLIIKKFNHAVIGQQVPVSSIKFNIASPSATLAGNVYLNKKRTDILNLSITAGFNNGLNEVFSGNQLSEHLSFTPSFTFIYHNNSAGIDKSFPKGVITMEKDSLKKTTKKLDITMASALVYSCLTTKEVRDTPTLKNLYRIYEEKQKELYPSNKVSILKVDTITRAIISKFNFYEQKKTTDELIALLLADSNWSEGRNKVAYATFVENLKANLALAKKGNDSIYTLTVNALGKYYTYTRIWWLNLAPYVSNSKFYNFHSTDSTVSKEYSFLYGLKISGNYFRKYTQSRKYLYINFGGGIGRTSNLIELADFNFKKKTIIKTKDTTEVSKEETGKAYVGNVKFGLEASATAQVYWQPWKEDILPGLFASLQYSYGTPWLSKNKLAPLLGFLFNVTSSDKDDKNLLTIVPYASFLNILPQKDASNPARNTPLHDLFSVGFRVGIPINIGK